MILFLQANDTFFFRDARPFTKGDHFEGYSIFPPLPPTILGALRTAHIAEQGNLSAFYNGKMATTIGTPNSFGTMHLNGVFLADKKSGIYYPIPLDLVTKKKEKDPKLYLLEGFSEKPHFISNAPLKYHLRWNTDDEDVESEVSGRLRHLDLRRYLLRMEKTFRFRSIENFVTVEPKIGIQRDYQTSAAKDNMLYRINMRRFQSKFIDMSKIGFVVDYQCNEELPENGLLKLGGEGKSFTYEPSRHHPDPLATEADIEYLKKTIRASGVFKLYFATPAIFDQGWLPKWINNPTYETQDLSLKLITAAVGKPIAIGGWDMKKNIPKPMRQAVPAGSVYYFKICDETHIDTILNTFHYKNISDSQANEGLGLCFVGVAEGGTV